MTLIEYIVIAFYFGAIAFIFSYSLIQLDLLRLYKTHSRSKPDPLFSKEKPLVCIQLPIYNERYVVERLIDSCLKFNYPHDRLEIQILDDSTDDTTKIIEEKLSAIQSEISLVHVRRPDRTGYKAGALAYGMERTKADYIAIFDADFIPDPEFLNRTMCQFVDKRVGVVQTRWTHLNEDADWMTRIQAFGLNAHFTVEQMGRAEGNHFLNFNGTAGIWRKECIAQAGGWQHDTLTEDLDLSYRAQFKGWRIAYDEDIESPAELPITMGALKSQQFRWTKGAAQCSVKHLPNLIRSKNISLKSRIHAIFHLMNSFVFIAILMVSALSIPIMHIRSKYDNPILVDLLGTVFLSSLMILGVYYHTAYIKANPKGGLPTFLGTYLLFLSASMGMSFHNSRAVFEAYAGIDSAFVRTPKFNVQRTKQWISNEYISQIAMSEVLVEICLSLLFTAALIYGVFTAEYAFVFFHSLLAVGFGVLAFTAVAQNKALTSHHSTMKASAL
ncbi:MAG: glycosyltransferase [Flavobacteriales bacterium]|nr:glycosyltransferase [Flavobacteriales bacterium]MBT4705315.1 glycosyltransferase [Flavobacteriales bacterium]MBT4929933.1 glycosyltransferase [Flavobacteriales bacterium]MBT5132307.1 glycosyltransferase [Flavobacteriales bacterium]MBT6132976.1 glycosyltransferase [Flavobacteriales bacterium]